MKKTRDAVDTGIYYDPPQAFVDASDPAALATWVGRTNQQFDVGYQLDHAEQFAQAVLARYPLAVLVDDTRKGRRNAFEPGEPISLSLAEQKEWEPVWLEHSGLPPHHSDGNKIPDNVKRQVTYAVMLKAYIQTAQKARQNGDAEQAAMYGFLAGRHYEALRTCQLERVTRTGRKVRGSASRGHQALYGTTEEKQKRWAEYQANVNKIQQENPTWSHHKVAGTVAREFHVTARTVERHTVLTSPTPPNRK